MGQKFIDLIRPFKGVSWPLFIISLVIILFTFFLLIFKSNYPPFLPLWYSREWGLGRLATPVTLYIVPILALTFLLINYYLANLFRTNNLALGKILIWASFLTAVASFITIYKLLLIS